VATGSELPGESYDVLSSLLWKFWDTEAIGISADSTDDSSDQTLLESTILATTLRYDCPGRRVTAVFLITLLYV